MKGHCSEVLGDGCVQMNNDGRSWQVAGMQIVKALNVIPKF